MAKISAHETLFLQLGMASTAALALITVSNPSPANDKLSGWSFSALLFEVDATITDASHPYIVPFSYIINTKVAMIIAIVQS